MSARSESAPSPSPCACTNISLMQLFHELKQKFPGVPDHVVSNTIELYCHDKLACETHLHSEVKASLQHAYHASSSAAARQLNELKINPPVKCRNQPIFKHEAPKSTLIKPIICQGPQNAVIKTNSVFEDTETKLCTDANQNVVECKSGKTNLGNEIISPVAIINIDNCYAKYNAESPSDIELTNENAILVDKVTTSQEEVNILQKINNLHETNTLQKKVDIVQESKSIIEDKSSPLEENISKIKTETVSEEELEQPESINYKIYKSNKIKSNLNERLERGKDKKTIKKEEIKQETAPEKPVRPNTLDFIKPNPDIAFKPTLKEPQLDTNRSVSPVPNQKHEKSTSNHNSNTYRTDRGYPLNLSVNVNCHMDLSHSYGDSWLEDYDSPRTITSVNLTVCTPTSNMASPIRESREPKEEGGFEGHVTVTVSPSSTRGPRRHAPPPPSHPSRLDSHRPTRVAPAPPEQPIDRSLIERQKERLGCLAKALAQEKNRLAKLTRETRILAAPPPSPMAARRLRDFVHGLRAQCDMLAKRLEVATTEREEPSNFYSENFYTGQRPPASWQCHMCTFRNHPLLDKCEECDMPRILVVRATDGITVRLMPGRRKFVRSWIL